MLLPMSAKWLMVGVGAVLIALPFGYQKLIMPDARRRGITIGTIVAAVIGGALALWMLFVVPTVIIVHGSPPTAEKQILIGSSTVELSSGKLSVSGFGKKAIVVNDSDHTLEIQTVEYSTVSISSFGGPQAVDIEPHSVYDFDHTIDNIGPDDSPPSEVSSKSSSVTKYWLTW